MWFLKKLFQKRDEQLQDDGDVVKPFLDHLEDLRWTLMKMIGTLGATMLVAFAFRKQITAILGRPLHEAVPDAKIQIIDPIGPISLSFSLSFYAGIIVSFPIIFFFLAEFLLPALTKKEKKYVFPAVGVGFGLFLIGVLLCYFFVLPPTLRWLHNDARDLGISPQWTGNAYYGFITHLCIAVGLVCELPVVMVTLSCIGLISYAWLKSMRVYGYAIALVLAGIISPTPDLFMLFIFALPIMMLFEVCIWIVWFLEKRRAAQEEKLAKEEAAAHPHRTDVGHAGYDDPHHDPHHDEQARYHDEHAHYQDEQHYSDEHHGQESHPDAPPVTGDAEKPADPVLPEPPPATENPDKPAGPESPDKPQ
jgi:sec-independent protein translocase protein TatC